MIIGIPKEIKAGERRVTLTPDAVRELVAVGATIKVETGAGAAAGFDDAAYKNAGATIAASAALAFDADLVVKVKEIQPGEWQRLRPGGMLFSFLHLGAGHAMARELLNRRMTGIAFETVSAPRGGLPILAPMSAIAGELAVPIAAHLLCLPTGGRGLLFSDANVLIVGAGAAGTAAAISAIALGAKVSIAARTDARLAPLRAEFGERIVTLTLAGSNIAELARHADVVIAAVNIVGAATPKLLRRTDIAAMLPGAVLIEICIDGGGIAETSHPTTLAAPTYIEDGVIHYCVPNMPAAVPRSASLKISAAVLPFVKALSQHGLLRAMRDNDGLAAGLQMHGGQITHREVAAQLGLPCLDLDAVLFSC